MSSLHQLSSATALSTFISTNHNALICYSATWCGPCTRFKPLYEQFASLNTSRVACGIAYEHEEGMQEYIQQKAAVRGFPTFVLYVGGTEAERCVGGNLGQLEAMVKGHCTGWNMEGGNSLGGTPSTASTGDVRALRLGRLGAAAPEEKTPTQMETETTTKMESETVTKTGLETNPDTASQNDAEKPDVVMMEGEECPPGVDSEMLVVLLSMDIPRNRAIRSLLGSSAKTVEGAIDWIANHQDDEDIDDPVDAETKVARSFRCNTTGKILSSVANLELYANRTGYTDFSESTEAVKELTPEEKAEKLKAIKELLSAKRRERETKEKEQDLIREKARRTMGQETQKTREEMQIDRRKHDAYIRKKEKQDQKRERERIRAELAKDKAERASNRGKLGSRLGVDGYNPDGIQYDNGTTSSSNPTADARPVLSRDEKLKRVDEYIGKVSSYRAGDDGKKCLKVLFAYVKNIVDKPTEDKFKSINMDNNAYKTKVKPFIGARSLLLTVGFEIDKSDEGKKLVLAEDVDQEVLRETKERLKAALAK